MSKAIERYRKSKRKADPVNHPSHYTQHPSGVECIEITEAYNFNIGNAIKYLWRAGLKGDGNPEKHREDLQKARWYITRELMRLDVEATRPSRLTK